MSFSDPSKLKKGTLLIASPEMPQGFFHRGVVLLCEYTPNGCFGVIINKALNLDVPEDMILLEELSASANVQLRAGGPIQMDQMMLLHTSKELKNTLDVCDGIYLGGDMEFLQEAIGQENGPTILLCFGYTGWGPGVLEKEIMGGLWILKEAKAADVFTIAADKLWRTLLKDMGGKYAMLSMIPEDLSLN